ncbi:XdhC family protein [Luteibacter aegosomatissinici]|uniref:XdhC family protein n=1 Tax=Luteibacter aegosomatissinici TaxID=2911539 RepID=UPI001FF9964C|nr:XdhC family protein [Luteibacter aegosomatissinici]UPG92751.1 XdhC family protein [Luteibacter aegosomatissinici]
MTKQHTRDRRRPRELADAMTTESVHPSRMPDWPWYAVDDDLLGPMAKWHAQGLPLALATLVSVEGSSPRPLGSEMAIARNGQCAGYVSGGCVEAAVVDAALGCLRDNTTVMLDYGAGSPVLDLQLSCGGRIHILVRPVSDAGRYIDLLRAAGAARRTVTIVTSVTTGRWHAVDGETPVPEGHIGRVHRPALRLVVVGADPVALALADLAHHTGLEVVLVRPDGPDGPPPLPRIGYIRGSLGPALSAAKVDARTAIYTFTHDDDTDHAVLCQALTDGAFAAGALGSRQKTDARRRRLLDAGFDVTAVHAVHLPAGTKSPAMTSPRFIATGILGRMLSAAPMS